MRIRSLLPTTLVLAVLAAPALGQAPAEPPAQAPAEPPANALKAAKLAGLAGFVNVHCPALRTDGDRFKSVVQAMGVDPADLERDTLLLQARAYLAHPVLGPRLRECTEAVLAHPDRSAEQILGGVDALKLRSSMTLFARADPAEPIFGQALDALYGGEPDARTDQRQVRPRSRRRRHRLGRLSGSRRAVDARCRARRGGHGPLPRRTGVGGDHRSRAAERRLRRGSGAVLVGRFRLG